MGVTSLGPGEAAGGGAVPRQVGGSCRERKDQCLLGLPGDNEGKKLQIQSGARFYESKSGVCVSYILKMP